jgi:hypothetical protein
VAEKEKVWLDAVEDARVQVVGLLERLGMPPRMPAERWIYLCAQVSEDARERADAALAELEGP